jgi:hypothetical protein
MFPCISFVVAAAANDILFLFLFLLLAFDDRTARFVF